MNKTTSILLAALAVVVVAAAVFYGVKHDNAPSEPDSDARTTQHYAGNPKPVENKQQDIVVPALSTSKIGWGTGKEVNELNQTVDSIRFQDKYGQYGGCFIFPEDENTIYLTFDLGYENGYTASILDTLAKYNVKATFFITMDYVDEAPLVVERIIREGHTLGNHTVKHPSIPDITDERTRTELMDLHNYIKEKYGYEMKLFRYPMGEFSEHSLNYIDSLGYKSIFWSFAYKDWVVDAQPNPTDELNKITESLHPGAIYLLHAVSSTNDKIMEDFVKTALDKGYKFALIDERLGLVEREMPSTDEGLFEPVTQEKTD